MAAKVNNCEQFRENRMEFDEKIVTKIDNPSFPLNILKKVLKSELLFDVTLHTEVDSTR